MINRRKLGKRNRRAGHDYERKIAREMRELGFKKALTSRYSSRQADDAGTDIVNTPFKIQCKNSKNSVNYEKVLNEIEGEGLKVIFHKKNRKEFVIMSKDTFYRTIKQWYSKTSP